MHAELRQSAALGDSDQDRQDIMKRNVVGSFTANKELAKTAVWKWEGAVSRARTASQASK